MIISHGILSQTNCSLAFLYNGISIIKKIFLRKDFFIMIKNCKDLVIVSEI